MAENVSITWAPDPRASHSIDTVAVTKDLEDGSEPGPEDNHPSDQSQHVGTATNTQRNTPIALAAQHPVDPIDDDEFDMGEGAQFDYVGSSGLGPNMYQRSLQWPTQSSFGSLSSLSEREYDQSPRLASPTANRGLPTTSSQSQNRGRRSSHSKSFSTSYAPPHRVNNERPTYPAQSIEELRTQLHAPRPTRPLRTKSSLPSQNLLYNEMSLWTQHGRQFGNSQGPRTADNTPMSSPGLRSDDRAASASSLSDADRPARHFPAPTTTKVVSINHDTFSGNKFINDYEVIEELGRGEHGKVKLGRDLKKESVVAIKIVPRFSGKRRLGRLGTPEDRTKREVAILKKARHPNVVSLLEVIDDPKKNKVYLVLEYVEKGEIKWRKPGVREVLAVNNNRFEQERKGITLPLEATEKDIFSVAQAKRRHEIADKTRAFNAFNAHRPIQAPEHWGEDLDEDEGFSDISRSASRQLYDSSNPSRTHSHDEFGDNALSGSMYGAYASDAYHPARKFSIAASVGAISHMSSEWNFDETDDEHAYVPALTLEEARRAFRDTLSGLQFLHYVGIIHRDIKPANLLVSSNGTVKISDFGVSYLGHPKDPETDPEFKLTENDVSVLDDERDLARSVGTPAFWAPEMCYEDPSIFEEQDGPKITGAIDLWALGITLYCMVYARLPFYANDTMGLHEAVCKTEVFLPKTRLVPVDTTQEKPSAQGPSSINCNKRLDYELKFEAVPDAVRDLIRQLLIKEPTKRMTIEQAKKHEWVVEGLQDPSQWMRGPDQEKEVKRNILDVDEKEMSGAVTKMSIFEKALNTVGRGIGSILKSSTRRRAPSAATSTSHSSESIASPSASSASTVGKPDRDKYRDGRRASLRGDDVLDAIKHSRETTEHPLAQSQTASPDSPGSSHYFGEYFSATKPASPAYNMYPGRDTRPHGPGRMASTTDSVKTIRASQLQRLPLPAPETTRDQRPVSQERGIRAKVDGLWEGTAKTLARLGSRDRRSQIVERSPSSSRHSSESDAYAGASVALSTASAEGAIEPPEALKYSDIPDYDDISPAALQGSSHGTAKTSFQAPASTAQAFEQAQEVNQRRFIQEAHQQAIVAAEVASRPPSQVTGECPPSPDDITFLEKQSTRILNEPQPYALGSSAIHSGPSASTIASSLDGYGASSVSQSLSDPSLGIISGASSPPGEGYLNSAYLEAPTTSVSLLKEPGEPEFMRTADTVIKHGRPTQVATARALEDWGHDDDDDDGDDDSEDGMMMPTSTKKKL